MKAIFPALLLAAAWVCGASFSAQAVPIGTQNSGTTNVISGWDYRQKWNLVQSPLFPQSWHGGKRIGRKKPAPLPISKCATSPTFLPVSSPPWHHGLGFQQIRQQFAGTLRHGRPVSRSGKHPAGSPPANCSSDEENGSASNGASTDQSQIDNGAELQDDPTLPISPDGPSGDVNSVLIDGSNDITPSPESLIEPDLLPNEFSVNGNDTPVSEPATLWLLAGGLATIVLIGRVRRATVQSIG